MPGGGTHFSPQVSEAWIHSISMLLRKAGAAYPPPYRLGFTASHYAFKKAWGLPLLHISLLLEAAEEMLSTKSPQGGRMVEALACGLSQPTTRGARVPSGGRSVTAEHECKHRSHTCPGSLLGCVQESLKYFTGKTYVTWWIFLSEISSTNRILA